MRRLRILVLMHKELVPPEQLNGQDLEAADWKPHIAFNLLEEFDGMAVYDQNVVSYLELMRIPYTGCNPRGLMLARDKALSKKLMAYHRIPVPMFTVVKRGQKP